MRKVNPDDVRDAFTTDIADLLAYLDRAGRGLAVGAQAAGDTSRLMSMSFLTLYVSFERFASDIFLAYMNRDFSKYQSWLESRVASSVKDKMGEWEASRIKFDKAGHLSIGEIEKIVDKDGWNLTFKDAATMNTRAGEWLNAASAARVHSLVADDIRLIDTAKAIRDFIAHDSPSSKDKMNDQLASVGQGVGRGQHLVHSVGVYLKAMNHGQRRLSIYAERLIHIAQKM